ncbi:3-oxoacyl-ACP reductase [Pseudomonas saudimassiliensis]|uniref:3-oxoacyl-ACP reductase n=1 Tax=Pseudomonas saudimassiliensis TaxID=1461581 RepID=A0A078M8H8_9PSED|nr:SDR family oxidoreductase [Pseudomonas saudimassiliensis]MCO5785282.1 short chain dehydrogenase [Pseudomonas sp. G11-1]MCO5788614.1 short chain dehydrogenase [Pseudomonas sp. G11-2]CEA02589.1 3-oxoacyl-ACP reductase [Pseudomonas saudimassiliensis]CEF25884.1 3-oxoacyl-ACP reductase [Pseudomonas saudimassiliensis]
MKDLKNPEYVSGHGLLKGKSVLITAAAGAGIGGAAALKAVEEGCRGIVISDVHEGRLAASVEKLKQDTGLAEVWGKLCNVTDEAEVRALIDFAEDKLQGIDVLINNAGLGTTKALIEMEDAEWNKVIDVTLNGTMRMTRYMLQVMKARGQGGVIVNNASVLGWRGQKEQAHYAAAKAGVMALTRCSALEAAELNVRINAVAPSLAVHPMLRKSAPEALLKELEGREAYGRGAECWEVANVMMFLASDYSSYMTGEVVPVSSQQA